MREAIIPDYIYLNKEKLQSGELTVTIGEIIKNDSEGKWIADITHEFIDVDVAQEMIDEALKRW